MVLAFVFSFSACGSSVSETQTTTTISITRPEVQSLRLSTLTSMIDDNIVAAQEEFEGNLYTFTIKVTDIFSAYIHANVYDSTTTSDYSCGWVQVILDKSDISSLRKGDVITIEGYVEISELYGKEQFHIVDAVVVE